MSGKILYGIKSYKEYEKKQQQQQQQKKKTKQTKKRLGWLTHISVESSGS